MKNYQNDNNSISDTIKHNKPEFIEIYIVFVFLFKTLISF